MLNFVLTKEQTQRKEGFRKMKERKGITLLALVVTIIVLIILAAVTIMGSSRRKRNNKRAMKAVEEHKIEL